MPSFTILNGDQAGTRFDLGKRTLSIGREPARDIQLIDPKVSRKHAIVRHDDGRYLICATKALNGVSINGTAITDETALNEGDEVALGGTLLRFGEPADGDKTNAVLGRKNADRDLRDARTVM